MMRFRLLPLTLAAAFALLLPGRAARAVTINPPSAEFSVVPGQTITMTVKLFNETGEAVTEYASTGSFTAKDETGTPEFPSAAASSDLAGWISIAPGPFTLQSGERIELPVTISVPADAEPGGHYAAIFFSNQPSTPAGGAGRIDITYKVVSLIMVRVSGAVNESATLASFSSGDDRSFYTRLPVSFAFRMTNNGNVHVRPTGSVTVRNMFGGKSAELALNTAQGAVLPQSTRRFDTAWEKQALVEERGNFFQEVGRQWRNFALGPYTATLSATYGVSGDKTLSATYRFWVIPWQLLFVEAVVLVLVGWLLVLLVRWYNGWIVSKAGGKRKRK